MTAAIRVLVVNDAVNVRRLVTAARARKPEIDFVGSASDGDIGITGMGNDGLNGAGLIAVAGGTVLVQEEATSVVRGMPGTLPRGGLTNGTLPPTAIRDEAVQCTRGGLVLAGQP